MTKQTTDTLHRRQRHLHCVLRIHLNRLSHRSHLRHRNHLRHCDHLGHRNRCESDQAVLKVIGSRLMCQPSRNMLHVRIALKSFIESPANILVRL